MKANLTLSAPVRGEWAILNPPGHPEIVYDFLAVDKNKFPYSKWHLLPHLFGRIPVQKTFAWDQPVYSPCDGTVVSVGKDAPDSLRTGMIFDLVRLGLNRPEPNAPFSRYGGNWVTIKTGEHFVMLAHFRQNSIVVNVGDRVKVGDILGRVGNSGSSIQPHLHMQVMSSENPLPLYDNLVPFKLAFAELKEKGEWTRKSDFLAENKSHFKFS